MDTDDERHLDRACSFAVASVESGGGPFGAVIVRGAQVVATGINRVTSDHDPTAHAEMEAIRVAGHVLDTHDLAGCTLYASCRPCPMCMTAAWWARLDRIVHAATADDAAAAGFDDARFWEAMVGRVAPPVVAEHLGHPEASAAFDAWAARTDRVAY